MKDPIISPKQLEKFESGFITTTTVKLEASGHVPQEEEPLKVTEAIRNFIGTNERELQH